MTLSEKVPLSSAKLELQRVLFQVSYSWVPSIQAVFEPDGDTQVLHECLPQHSASCSGAELFATELEREAYLIAGTLAHLLDVVSCSMRTSCPHTTATRAPSLLMLRANAVAPVLYFIVSTRLSDIVL